VLREAAAAKGTSDLLKMGIVLLTGLIVAGNLKKGKSAINLAARVGGLGEVGVSWSSRACNNEARQMRDRRKS